VLFLLNISYLACRKTTKHSRSIQRYKFFYDQQISSFYSSMLGNKMYETSSKEVENEGLEALYRRFTLLWSVTTFISIIFGLLIHHRIYLISVYVWGIDFSSSSSSSSFHTLLLYHKSKLYRKLLTKLNMVCFFRSTWDLCYRSEREVQNLFWKRWLWKRGVSWAVGGCCWYQWLHDDSR
jgi:hypothetical protein